MLLFKTGTVAQKNDFCIFRFRNIKYKKPDPVYRLGPDRKRKKNPKTDRSRPVFETLGAGQGPGPRARSGGALPGAALWPGLLLPLGK